MTPSHDPLPDDARAAPPTPEAIRKRQRSRAAVMAVLLGGFVLLMFAITIVKIGTGH